VVIVYAIAMKIMIIALMIVLPPWKIVGEVMADVAMVYVIAARITLIALLTALL
jgi:hypothetical protein